jgi:hypothetical protein
LEKEVILELETWSMVEHLPSKSEALNSNLSTTKRKKISEAGFGRKEIFCGYFMARAIWW